MDIIFWLSIATIAFVVVTWGYFERKFDEREAQRDIQELMNKGYSYQEAVFIVENAGEY